MDDEKIHYQTISEVSRRLRAGEISPIEVVDRCLERANALNQRLNPFALLLADRAREQANQAAVELQGGNWRGPLHGIPVGIKDFYDTAHIRTTAAWEKLKDRVPTKDAVSVAKLREAGAIVIGKMNMHTLGMGTTGLESLFGPVRNPWNTEYIAGGSSSGSAAAVAAGICYATLDTDAIGSCRLPASCCGVVGFKGTYGLISTRGILEGEPADETIVWFSHAGITTRSAEDTLIVLQALAEPRESFQSFASDPKGAPAGRLRIGVADNFDAEAQVRRAFESAVETIAVEHEVVAAKAPFDMPPFGDLHAIDSDRNSISSRTFRDIDALLLPTIPTTVLSAREASGRPRALSPAHTMFANYFGLPALTVPCGVDENGLPIGLQIVGKPRGDRTVLTVARQYQLGSPFGTRRPVP